MSFDQVEHISSPTGADLALRIAAIPRAKAVIQINHGLAEHSGRYSRFAAFMNARGYTILANDHRGHGQTIDFATRNGDLARRNEANLMISDSLFVLEEAARRFPCLPIITFGHSMGGLIALNLIGKFPGKLQGAAIWNANFSAGLQGRLAQAILAWERFRRGSDVPSSMLPKLTFRAWGKAIENARTDFDWLSRDPEEVDAYIADPLCGWDASVALWQDIFTLVFNGPSKANLDAIPHDLPLHLVGGAADPATNNGGAVKQLRDILTGAGFLDVTTKIYAQTRHESLNDVNRETVMTDFADWADTITQRVT